MRASRSSTSQSGEFLGLMALVNLDLDTAEAEAGYITASRARGRGVATRALRLLSAWAFAELPLERIELLIDVANPASEVVAQRCRLHARRRAALDLSQARASLGHDRLLTAPARAVSADRPNKLSSMRWPRKNDADSIRARQEALGLDGLVTSIDLAPFVDAAESVTGVAVIPVSVVGPLEISLGDYELDDAGAVVERGRARDEIYVPLAHTEGGLSASLSRGAKAAAESGGFKTHVLHDRITRASCFICKDTEEAVRTRKLGRGRARRGCAPGSPSRTTPSSRVTPSCAR